MFVWLSFAIFVSLLAVFAWFLYGRLGHARIRREATHFMRHLEELRVRIVRAGLIIVGLAVLFLSFHVEFASVGALPIPVLTPTLHDTMAASVYRHIVDVAVPDEVRLVVTAPTEAFTAQMAIAFLLALLVGSPFVGYEVWAFLSPGLSQKEQRLVVNLVPVFVILFAIGGMFGFLLVVPMLLSVLYGFAGPLGATPLLAASSLVGTVLTMTLIFGLAFELPLVMAALVQLGVVEPAAYVRKWRHAIIVIFVAGALVTDPTLMSQIIVSVILVALYAAGVIAGFVLKGRASRVSADR